MTRINLSPPAELCDQHLLGGEWRELTRIPNAIAKCVVDGHMDIETFERIDEFAPGFFANRRKLASQLHKLGTLPWGEACQFISKG